MLAAQCCHAAGESSPGSLPDGTSAVVLAASDEQQLRDIASRLAAAGVTHKLVVENDAPYAGQAMAIGVTPGERSKLKKYFTKLPLLQ